MGSSPRAKRDTDDTFIASNGKKTEFILDKTAENDEDVEEYENDGGNKPRHLRVAFAPGDQVYLRLHKGYSIPAIEVLGRKLSQQYVGPFKVLQRVGKLAYKLELPPYWRVHDVFSVTHLEPAPPGDDPFERQPQPLPPLHTEADDTGHYEIEKLVDKRA